MFIIPADTLISFFIASIILALVPGPDNLFVIMQSAMSGPRAGLLVVFGLCTGLIVHTIAVIAGLAAVLQVSTIAYTVLKVMGAAYLLYLAWQAFRASASAIGSKGESEKLSALQLYRRGAIMSSTNPKVSLFFLAFLPQFTNPQYGSITHQLLILSATFMVAALLIFGLIAYLSGFLGEWFIRSAKAQKIINWLAGIVFAGLAFTLVATN